MASLRQAAAVGRVSVDEVVNKLRAAVGQAPLSEGPAAENASYFSSRPGWFDESKVVDSIDEQDVDPDVMPLRPLLLRATKLEEGEMLELVTAYLPAPGIDIMKAKGFATWTVEQDQSIKTYFSRPAAH